MAATKAWMSLTRHCSSLALIQRDSALLLAMTLRSPPTCATPTKRSDAASRTAAQLRPELGPGTTHQRLRRQEPELFVQPIDPAIRRIEVVLGDVVPDLRDVVSRQGPTRDAGHSAFAVLAERRVRACRFTAALSQASAGPLATPRPISALS